MVALRRFPAQVPDATTYFGQKGDQHGKRDEQDRDQKSRVVIPHADFSRIWPDTARAASSEDVACPLYCRDMERRCLAVLFSSAHLSCAQVDPARALQEPAA
jgi:hypothetical protein